MPSLELPEGGGLSGRRKTSGNLTCSMVVWRSATSNRNRSPARSYTFQHVLFVDTRPPRSSRRCQTALTLSRIEMSTNMVTGSSRNYSHCWSLYCGPNRLDECLNENRSSCSGTGINFAEDIYSRLIPAEHQGIRPQLDVGMSSKLICNTLERLTWCFRNANCAHDTDRACRSQQPLEFFCDQIPLRLPVSASVPLLPQACEPPEYQQYACAVLLCSALEKTFVLAASWLRSRSAYSASTVRSHVSGSVPLRDYVLSYSLTRIPLRELFGLALERVRAVSEAPHQKVPVLDINAWEAAQCYGWLSMTYHIATAARCLSSISLWLASVAA
jgi:hypothetical protein